MAKKANYKTIWVYGGFFAGVLFTLYKFKDKIKSLFINKEMNAINNNSDASSAGVVSGFTLGERNNNPLNIRYNSANNWDGQTGSNKGFCVFSSVVYGIRAGFKLLNTYSKKGVCTVEAIIKRFAPPTENDTENYINYVCGQTGHNRNDVVSISLADAGELLRAMCKMECGYKLDDNTLLEAANLAGIN